MAAPEQKSGGSGMVLKCIEIQGFKSFANRIRLDFQQGITAIVGPNGSGKSNVSDAVRWVLGEQSAKSLRGENMQDVIFAGTETRKPQGFAYVAVTLDNSGRILPIDYDEVTVSRRLYRSGESEYRINGSTCRLRDISELFFDTGIGQEGYSIIGQGRVEQILSGKADERRELFDEAAGITKFRKRKALAEKKLESERADLVRVTDILTELEKQIGPLRKQSETAQEYLRLREEIKLYDLNLFLREAEKLRSDLEDVTGREQILERDAADAAAAGEKLREEYEGLETLLSGLDREITEGQTELTEVTGSISDLAGKINVSRERINTERANAAHISERLETLERECSGKRAEQSALRERKEKAETAARQAEKRAEEEEWKLVSTEEEMMLLDQKIQKLKDDVMDLVSERGEISARGERSDTRMEQAQVQASENAKRLLDLRTAEEELDRAVKEAVRARDEVNSERQSLKARRGEAEKSEAEAKREIDRIGGLLRKAQSEYQEGSVRLEYLKNLAERYDGYGNSIRRVMETRGRIGGIHGVVADLISVDEKYETAIETALGGRIQNIVTDSEETAKRLIAYLKQNRYGRATFLPLSSAGRAGTRGESPALEEEGVIGCAADLIRTEAQYRGLMQNLLGRDLVVTDIDRAVRIEQKYRYTLRIVTLEGELLNPGGAISGGAFRNSSNLLGRKREIEELAGNLDRITRRAEQIEEELKKAQEEERKASEEIDSVRALEQDVLVRFNSAELSLKRLAEKKRDLAGDLAGRNSERESLKARMKEITAEKNQVTEDLRSADERRSSMEEQISALSSRMEEAREKRDTLVKSQSDAKLAAGTAEQENRFAGENLSRVEAELQRLSKEREALTGGTSDTEERIREKEEEIRADQDALGRLREREEALKRALAEQTAEKEAHSGEQRKYFEKRNETEERRNALERDLLRVRNQKEKTGEKLSARTSEILTEYNLTEEGAAQYRSDSLGAPAGMRKRIDEDRAAVRALGNVNVNAIEDYKSVSGRYEFLKTQHGDLKKAEESLEKIIAELDQGMRKQFTEQFGKIQEEFNRVFRELFGGGRGELKLEEGADVLDAAVSIIAEPPGKKLQNMMQLSGGEKALTAIALLFAIQNLRPSPFALLDEIEAALDDSNVDRFAQYLKNLTSRTQFIVITHRRGTMVAADRLYGITMQEKGVSTLVSVNLIEDQLDA